MTNKRVISRIGEFPEDWIVTRIGDIANVTKLAGFEFTKHITYKEDGEIIALRALNLKKGKLDLTDVKRIDKNISEILIRSKLFKGDIVFSYVGTIGEVAIIEEDDKYHLGPNVAKIVVKKIYDPKYVTYYLISENANKEISRLLTTSSQPALSMGNIREIQIPIPPLGEQQKIASILSTWDKAIELKEKLIEQKKEQKKGLMQKLLTGEVRLPGYKEDWQTKKLIDLCLKIMDGTHATPRYTDKGIPFYSVENVTNRDFTNHKYISFEEHQSISSRCKVEKGDILMTRIGSIGDAVLVDWDYECSIYVSLALLKTNNKILPEFLVRYMATNEFKKEILSKSLLSAIPQKINLVDIGRVNVHYPMDLQEQKAIADIFNEADKEISLLTDELNQLQNQKKGLMQLLLTGKVRVKV